MFEASLKDKLGLKDDMSTYFGHAPIEYFEALGHRTQTHRPDDDGMFEFIHSFFTEKAQLESSSSILVSKLADNGMLWISWPNEAYGTRTDITEQELKDIFLPLGVVDVDSCKITENWDAVKFVWC
jgi:hypothetical protein